MACATIVLVRDTALLKGVAAMLVAAWVVYGALRVIAGSLAGTGLLAAGTTPSGLSALAAILVGGLLLGFFATLSGACPLRQHVLAGQGRVGAWAFLGGFYIAAVVYTSWISPHIGSWVMLQPEPGRVPRQRGDVVAQASGRPRRDRGVLRERGREHGTLGAPTLDRLLARRSASHASSLAELLGAESPDSLVFTKNATEALNLAICGLVVDGARVVTSSLEHNSVMRPLRALEAQRSLRGRRRGCRREHRRDRPRELDGAARRRRAARSRSRQTRRT